MYIHIFWFQNLRRHTIRTFISVSGLLLPSRWPAARCKLARFFSCAIFFCFRKRYFLPTAFIRCRNSGANLTIVSCDDQHGAFFFLNIFSTLETLLPSTMLPIYNATNSVARFYNKNYFTLLWKTLWPSTTLPMYIHSCKFRSQSYDRELHRQRCKHLQRNK
jgi:hypothetical protein